MADIELFSWTISAAVRLGLMGQGRTEQGRRELARAARENDLNGQVLKWKIE